MAETFSQRIKDDIARFVAEPTREGLQELIRFFGGEFDQYELKEAWPPLPRMAKTALAIANSGGGVILFGIRDATLEPVGLVELASKQAVFDTFRSYVPSPLLDEITLLDFDYGDASYEPLRGKQIQVLAIPDVPEAIPFVCEDEWHKEDEHVRRGAIYVRSGTNTREATYDQVQRLLNRRLDTISSQSSTNRVRRELEQLQLLYASRTRLAPVAHPDSSAHGHVNGDMPEFRQYLDSLIVQKQDLLERALGLIADTDDR
jgi:predicted HTH transcriptional regulator